MRLKTQNYTRFKTTPSKLVSNFINTPYVNTLYCLQLYSLEKTLLTRLHSEGYTRNVSSAGAPGRCYSP